MLKSVLKNESGFLVCIIKCVFGFVHVIKIDGSSIMLISHSSHNSWHTMHLCLNSLFLRVVYCLQMSWALLSELKNEEDPEHVAMVLCTRK